MVNKDTIKERENLFEIMDTPIINYVQNSKKIIFEDGIITLVYNYIKLINHHSSLSFLILKHIENMCAINNKLPDDITSMKYALLLALKLISLNLTIIL